MTDRPLTELITPDRAPVTLAAYERAGGYAGLRRALAMSPAEVQAEVTKSTLRGRGGAGFPTGSKWSFVPADADVRKYVVINGDEMEPGTMKDRLLLEGNPHQVVEGAAITAYAIGASTAYIFLRYGYQLAEERVARALAEAYAAGYLGRDIRKSGFSLEMYLHVSAGRYMCGEETGLLNALEGKRANPRGKPPFPQVSGLFGKPTIVNNVETAANLPHILRNGWEWYTTLGRGVDGGTKLFGASGRVRTPGVWELPMGTPLGEIFTDYAGGMAPGYRFRALLPGGASTAFLTEDAFATPMEFGAVEQAGSRLGTGTMIVLDDRTCPVGMQYSLQYFFARESCGWCTPCREGLPWVARTLQALEDGRGVPGDLDVLDAHTRGLAMGHTFCALAPGAMAPLESGLKLFREDFQRHIDEQQCPWR
jgi:NADH-quinone oxidoreductase subunit F